MKIKGEIKGKVKPNQISGKDKWEYSLPKTMVHFAYLKDVQSKFILQEIVVNEQLYVVPQVTRIEKEKRNPMMIKGIVIITSKLIELETINSKIVHQAKLQSFLKMKNYIYYIYMNI